MALFAGDREDMRLLPESMCVTSVSRNDAVEGFSQGCVPANIMCSFS